MALQGIKATLLPNEADYVIVDKEIALRWSTEDTDENWKWDDYLWELLEEQYSFDPWDGCDDDGCRWDGWSWVECDPSDGSDYGCDDWDRDYSYLDGPDYFFDPYGDDIF